MQIYQSKTEDTLQENFGKEKNILKEDNYAMMTKSYISR
jgi:hypothetical protein